MYPNGLFVLNPLKQIVINPNRRFRACVFLLHRIILIGLVLIIGQPGLTPSTRDLGNATGLGLFAISDNPT